MRELWSQKYKVPDVPEGESGPWKIDSFTVDEDAARLDIIDSGARAVRPGTYKRLTRNGSVIMSDTNVELRDHLFLFGRMKDASSVLIHGLGLGCAVNAAILHGVARIDVVELDADVIKLVGRHYVDKATKSGVQLNIYRGDARTYRFPPGASWDAVWHDIWDTICPDNLKTMGTLHRRYERRCKWQGSWARPECELVRTGGRS